MNAHVTHSKPFRTCHVWVGLLVAASGILFSSCQTIQEQATSEQRESASIAGKVAPEWTRKTPKSGEYLYITGYGKVTDRTTSVKRAVADGKDQISKWLEIKVQSILLEYGQDTALAVSRSVSRASISGVAQKELWVDSDGGVWVLLEVPRSVPVRQFEEATKTLTRNDAAAYSEQKMREALKKLEEELE